MIVEIIIFSYYQYNMEVLEFCSGQLSNRETLDLLKSNVGRRHIDLATILYETTSYLESSPAVSSSQESCTRFKDAIKAEKLDLSPLEQVQLINLKPQNPTELHLIVYNIEERFDEKQREQILELVRSLDISRNNQEEHVRKKQKVQSGIASK